MATIEERRAKAGEKREKKGKKPFTDMKAPPKDSIIPAPVKMSNIFEGFKKAVK